MPKQHVLSRERLAAVMARNRIAVGQRQMGQSMALKMTGPRESSRASVAAQHGPTVLTRTPESATQCDTLTGGQ